MLTGADDHKGDYIYDDVGKPIKISQVAARKETPEPAGRLSKGVSALLAILCVSFTPSSALGGDYRGVFVGG